MQTKYIIGTALAVVTLASTGFSGTPVCQPTPTCAPAKESPWKVSLESGYQSNYTYRGLVASHSIFEGDSVIPSNIDVEYKLCDINSIVGNIGYTAITSGHHYFGDRDLPGAKDQSNFMLGWQRKDWVKGLSTTLSYNITHGGFPGMWAKLMNGKSHSLTQEFGLDIRYNLCEKWHAGVYTSYSFEGVTGWWFMPYVGYSTAVCPYADLNVTAGMSATASYFNGNHRRSSYSELINDQLQTWDVVDPRGFQKNGAQAYWIKFEMPIKFCKTNDAWKLTPFVSFNWAGNAVTDNNKRIDKSDRIYKNFGVVAGASISYTF